MACDRKMLLLISCYADGEATAEEAEIAIRHLDGCPSCRKLVEEWKSQRQMFEWACKLQLPERFDLEERQVVVAQGEFGKSLWQRIGWNWRIAGGLAAVVVFGLVVSWFFVLPPMLPVGKTLFSAGHSEVVRLRWGVSLSIGPDSKVTRVDDRSIKLEKGWVAADVQHGNGLRIITKRLSVTDIGTRFWVGTSSEYDCVTVKDGVVSVEKDGVSKRLAKGSVLIAKTTGHPVVIPPPPAMPRLSESESQLYNPNDDYLPTTADDLDQREAFRLLAARFPNARVSDGGYVAGATRLKSVRIRDGMAVAYGARKALRDHYQEIAQTMAGGTTDGNWEIPVCYLFTYGIADMPELQGQAFYLRMVSSQGRLFWRLTGSTGGHSDFPVVFVDSDNMTRGCGHSGDVSGFQHSLYWGDPSKPVFTFALGDWPDKFKPAFSLKVKAMSASEYQAHDAPMLADAIRRTSRVRGLDIKDVEPNVLYLDPSRRHRLMLILNTKEAAKQMRHVRASLKRGHGGSVLMGVVATDVEWNTPALPAGTYLLWWTRSSQTQEPYWEISIPGKANRIKLANTSSDIRGACAQQLDDHMIFNLNYGRASRSGFSFGFVFERNGAPGKLGEGWIQISKS